MFGFTFTGCMVVTCTVVPVVFWFVVYCGLLVSCDLLVSFVLDLLFLGNAGLLIVGVD